MHKLLVNASDENFTNKCIKLIKNEGIVQIRGLCDKEEIENINKKLKKVFSKPSIGGSVGYTQKDPHKRTYDALMLGQETTDIVLNKKIIELSKKYFLDDPLLSHAYIKKNLGFNDFFFPYHCHTGMDRDVIRKSTKGYVLAMIAYLHDTDKGCFMYSPTTHLLKYPHGSNPYIYPEPLKSEIFHKTVKMVGKAGDILIFDDAGFHGPENPSKEDRTTLMFAYLRNTDFGGKIRNPAPIIPTSLNNINSEQLNVLGIGKKARNNYEDFHLRKYDESFTYKILKIIFDLSFTINLFLFKIKYKIKKLLGKSYE